MPTRRALLRTFAVLAASPAVDAFGEEPWPTRPIRLVSPYAPGGSNDVSARILAEALARRLGQPVVVENRPGAATRVANDHVARANADGYTVLFGAAPLAIVEALYGKSGDDPKKDLKPVSLAVVAPLYVFVNGASPIRDLRALIARGKAKPDGLTIGSPGAGTQPHLAAELFLRDTGVKGVVVQYRGDAMASNELLAGRIDATVTVMSTALPFVKSGQLRVLGVASTGRTALAPEIPTLAEQGVPNIVASSWFGVLVPAGVPDAIVATLGDAVRASLAEPDVRDKLLAQGLEPRPTSAAEFGRFIDQESRRWGALIRETGLKGE